MTAAPFDPFRHCRRELVVCMVLAVLLSIIALIPALTAGIILDRVIQTRAYATLLAILLVFALFHLCELVFTYVHDRLMLYITHSGVVKAEGHFWQTLRDAPYAELERLSDDDARARFLSIGQDVRLSADWIIAIAAIPLCLGIALVSLLCVSATLSALIAAIVVAFVLANIALSRSQRHAALVLQRTREREVASIDELFLGALSLKAHRAFDFGVKRWLTSKQAYESALQRWSAAAVRHGLAGLCFDRVTLALVLGAGAYEVVNGRLSVGQLVMANMLLRQVSTQVRQIAPLLHRRTAFRSSQAEMLAFLARKSSPERQVAAVHVHTAAAVTAQRLSFSTPAGRRLLDGIDFELPPGQSMAILGASGSGKTTLLKILSGLYVPSEGVVLINGLAPASRADLVYLSQREHLFDTDIEDNVALGRTLRTAAEKHLHHLDLGSTASTRGTALSGGERQRIFVARAMAMPDTGLFLDEPTTALDADRRAAVLGLLREAAQNRRLVVFATHDAELAALADYTLRLCNGRMTRFTARHVQPACASTST